MTKKERARLVIDVLAECYPDVKCALNYEKPHELLIATRLSAQCTDKRVNLVTPALFARFPDVDSFAAAEPDEVEEYIRSCGLYKTKAVDIVMMCRMIRDEFDGRVPDTIEQLVKLPGVGRKTANLIVGDLYGKPALVCDTHVIRVSGRIGLTDGTRCIQGRKTAFCSDTPERRSYALSQACMARQTCLRRESTTVRRMQAWCVLQILFG